MNSLLSIVIPASFLEVYVFNKTGLVVPSAKVSLSSERSSIPQQVELSHQVSSVFHQVVPCLSTTYPTSHADTNIVVLLVPHTLTLTSSAFIHSRFLLDVLVMTSGLTLCSKYEPFKGATSDYLLSICYPPD